MQRSPNCLRSQQPFSKHTSAILVSALAPFISTFDEMQLTKDTEVTIFSFLSAAINRAEICSQSVSCVLKKDTQGAIFANVAGNNHLEWCCSNLVSDIYSGVEADCGWLKTSCYVDRGRIWDIKRLKRDFSKSKETSVKGEWYPFIYIWDSAAVSPGNPAIVASLHQRQIVLKWRQGIVWCCWKIHLQ